MYPNLADLGIYQQKLKIENDKGPDVNNSAKIYSDIEFVTQSTSKNELAKNGLKIDLTFASNVLDINEEMTEERNSLIKDRSNFKENTHVQINQNLATTFDNQNKEKTDEFKPEYFDNYEEENFNSDTNYLESSLGNDEETDFSQNKLSIKKQPLSDLNKTYRAGDLDLSDSFCELEINSKNEKNPSRIDNVEELVDPSVSSPKNKDESGSAFVV